MKLWTNEYLCIGHWLGQERLVHSILQEPRCCGQPVRSSGRALSAERLPPAYAATIQRRRQVRMLTQAYAAFKGRADDRLRTASRL